MIDAAAATRSAREFGTSRLRLPREERAETVGSLRDAGLSLRAISAATGHDVKTIRGDLAQRFSDSVGEPCVAGEGRHPMSYMAEQSCDVRETADAGQAFSGLYERHSLLPQGQPGRLRCPVHTDHVVNFRGRGCGDCAGDGRTRRERRAERKRQQRHPASPTEDNMIAGGAA